MSDYEYVGQPGQRYVRWVEAQTPAGQAEGRRLAEDRFARSAHLAYEGRCYERYALVVWARTPEGQETAARAKTIGLFDPVSPDAGPVCPPKALADPDLCDWDQPDSRGAQRGTQRGGRQVERTASGTVVPVVGRISEWNRRTME